MSEPSPVVTQLVDLIASRLLESIYSYDEYYSACRLLISRDSVTQAIQYDYDVSRMQGTTTGDDEDKYNTYVYWPAECRLSQLLVARLQHLLAWPREL